MPRQELIVRVFAAAPEDVQAEVEALGEVVQDLNRALGRSSGIRLELLNWRTDIVPGLGEDPQAVINSQIGDDYDIFIGILWTRYGTPTSRAASGFEEEFEVALRKYEKDRDSISVMMYFKTAPASPDSIDPHQLAAVQKFRSHLRDQALYCTFTDREDFLSRVRLHLTHHVLSWALKHAQVKEGIANASSGSAPALQSAADVEEGLFDLLETSQKTLTEAAEAMSRLTALQEEHTARNELHTRQLEAIRLSPPEQRNRPKRLHIQNFGQISSLRNA